MRYFSTNIIDSETLQNSFLFLKVLRVNLMIQLSRSKAKENKCEKATILQERQLPKFHSIDENEKFVI